MRKEKLAPNQLIGRTIVDLFCSHPDADMQPYVAGYLLQLDNESWIALGSGSVSRMEAAEVKGGELFRHRLADRVRNRKILVALCCRSTTYDQTFIIVEGPLRMANCTIAQERMLFLRDSFDESYERGVEYWDYFTGTPVDFLGNPLEGRQRTPFRVSWS